MVLQRKAYCRVLERLDTSVAKPRILPCSCQGIARSIPRSLCDLTDHAWSGENQIPHCLVVTDIARTAADVVL